MKNSSNAVSSRKCGCSRGGALRGPVIDAGPRRDEWRESDQLMIVIGDLTGRQLRGMTIGDARKLGTTSTSPVTRPSRCVSAAGPSTVTRLSRCVSAAGRKDDVERNGRGHGKLKAGLVMAVLVAKKITMRWCV